MNISRFLHYDSMTWNFVHELAKLILPRHKRYKQLSHGVRPGCFSSHDEWEAVLDKMIAAFEWAASDVYCDEEFKDVVHQEGFDLFAKYYTALWT